MRFDIQTAFKWRTNAFHAADALLSFAGPPTGPDMTHYATAFMGDGGVYRYIAADVDKPAGFAMWNDTCTFIGIFGCTTASMGLAVIAGWEMEDAQQPASGINAVGVLWAERILSQLTLVGMPIRNNVIIAGHSGGSLAAMELALSLQLADPKRGVRVFTFGSPKDAVSRAPANFAGMDIRRFLNIGDTVGAMPPHPTQAFGFNMAMDIRQRQTYSKWGFAVSGIGLRENGTITYDESVYVTYSSDTLSLAAYMAGLDTYVSVPHGIAEYRRRLYEVAIVDNATLLPSEADANGPVRPRQVIPREEPRQFIMQQLAIAEANDPTIGSPERADAQATTIAIQQSQGAGNTQRYKARRIAKRWYVCYGTTIVWGPSTKRRCKARARRLNRTRA